MLEAGRHSGTTEKPQEITVFDIWETECTVYFIVYKIGVENVKFSGCVPVEIAYEKQNYTSLNIVVFFLLNNYFEKVEKQISFFFLSAVKNWIT